MDELLTVRQAADLCGLTPNAIWNWQHRGRISPDGLDDRGRPLYSQLTIARAEAATRRRAGRQLPTAA
ncbi:hypothetical protein [Kitasatospora cheerisanensis]|uniref:HTH merR-type domain-containing protein n=1 Tax=Kitasatospora cheerisanensis KCTC 2395 TaxID=1348663 RepID=A0A066YTY9_9ACTN|nr:hypothetical protein [Kitasatospora cheerisanensis]KDN83459.1 hypothetical protein KCH_49410 [Kitasatospora cheerisanensis KCTC 2395]